MNRVETTVFELAGPDRPGLLAEVTHLLTHNGCNIRSAAVRACLDWVLCGGSSRPLRLGMCTRLPARKMQ